MLRSWLRSLAYWFGLEDKRSDPVTIRVVKEVLVDTSGERDKSKERREDKREMDRMLVEINVTLSILKRDAELLMGEHPDDEH
jgi:hypothetical protein